MGSASLPGQVCLVWDSEAQLLPKKVAQDWHLSCSKPDMNHRQPHKVCVWRGYTRGALQFKPMGPTVAPHTTPSQPQLLPL